MTKDEEKTIIQVQLKEAVDASRRAVAGKFSILITDTGNAHIVAISFPEDTYDEAEYRENFMEGMVRAISQYVYVAAPSEHRDDISQDVAFRMLEFFKEWDEAEIVPEADPAGLKAMLNRGTTH